MNIKQRNRLTKAHDIICEILDEESTKQSNMETANTDHLEIYDQISDNCSNLEEIESFLQLLWQLSLVCS